MYAIRAVLCTVLVQRFPVAEMAFKGHSKSLEVTV